MEKHDVIRKERELRSCLKQVLDKLFHLVKSLDVGFFE